MARCQATHSGRLGQAAEAACPPRARRIARGLGCLGGTPRRRCGGNGAGGGVTARHAAESDAFGEIAAALVDELEDRSDLSRRIEAGYGLVVPVEHLALGIGAQAALGVGAA